MADAAPDTTDLEPVYRALLQQTLAQQQQPQQNQAPVDRGITSLLGEALGGGSQYGTPTERESAGNRALLNFGINALSASGYSPVRRTLGEVFASGVGGAQESLARSGSVAAAQLGAQQDYAEKQQQMQLARVKEAVPLLTALQTLRQQKALAALGSPLAPSTSIGAAGPGGPGTAGAELTGDKAHDLPLIAQRESGGDPTALNYVAKADPTAYDRGATASGKYQIVNSTWREGMQLAGIDASKFATARDAPEAVQDQVASALYDKYGNKPWQKGSKDWVRDEQGRYQLATVRPAAGAPGGAKTAPAPATAAAPQTPPAGSTPPAQTAFVPGGNLPYGAPGPAPAAPQAALVPPAAPAPRTSTTLRGTGTPATPAVPGGNRQFSEGEPVPAPYQIAGTDTGPPSSSFGIIGQAARAAEGGTTTTPPAVQAPQPATQATPQPQPASTATTAPIPPSTPESVPDTFEEYRKQHPIMPSAEDRAGFSTAPDAAQLAVLHQQAQIAKYAMDVARTQGDAGGLAKASEAYNTILASENTLRENANKAGADRRAAWFKDQDAQAFNAWKMAQDEKQKRITQQQQNDAASKLEQLRNKGQIDLEQAKTENAYTLEERKRFATDRDGARSSIDNLRMLRALSDNAGTTTPLDNIVVGNMTGRDFMSQIGMGTQAQQEKWGAQQAFIAAKNQMVIELRKGVQMGQLSDRDMSFLQAMGPDLLQKPETRTSILQLLENAQIRKLRYADSVEELHDGGMSWGKAKREADKALGPILPEVPKDYPTWSGAQKREFFQQHIPSRTIYRNSDGDLAVAP